MQTDPLGDMLTHIRNAQMRRHRTVKTPASRLRERVLEVLLDQGYIIGFSRLDQKGALAEFEIELKYHHGQPVIQQIERVSRPGRRIYASVKSMPVFQNGLGISILSTPKGVMADSAARRLSVGGEILCRVF